MTAAPKVKAIKIEDGPEAARKLAKLQRKIAKQHRKMRKGVRRFRPVRFIKPNPQRETNVRNRYIILGEIGSSGQYVLASLVNGEILAENYPLDEIELIPKDEL